MPVLIAIGRALAMLVPAILRMGKVLSFLGRFLKIVALHPITWTAVSFAPLLAFLAELITGKQIVSPIINGFFLQIISKILEFTLNVSLQDAVDLIPVTVREVSCWLGATEALQDLVNGLATASAVVLILRLKIFLIRLKIVGVRR